MVVSRDFVFVVCVLYFCSILKCIVFYDISDPSEVDSNVASPHVCHLEKLIGTGTNFSTRWYFDSKNGMCQPFPYSGVGGNENNFDSKILCLRKCSHAGKYMDKCCVIVLSRLLYDLSLLHNDSECGKIITSSTRNKSFNNCSHSTMQVATMV